MPEPGEVRRWRPVYPVIPLPPEQDDLFRLCVSCQAAEGSMERADGEYVCSNCYADAADYAFDRLRERGA